MVIHLNTTTRNLPIATLEVRRGRGDRGVGRERELWKVREKIRGWVQERKHRKENQLSAVR